MPVCALLKGTPMYLWQHNGCPGRYNQGCFRMSSHQGEIITDSMALQCHLEDATLHRRMFQKYTYTRQWKLKNWTRLSTKDNAHLIVIAGE